MEEHHLLAASELHGVNCSFLLAFTFRLYPPSRGCHAFCIKCHFFINIPVFSLIPSRLMSSCQDSKNHSLNGFPAPPLAYSGLIGLCHWPKSLPTILSSFSAASMIKCILPSVKAGQTCNSSLRRQCSFFWGLPYLLFLLLSSAYITSRFPPSSVFETSFYVPHKGQLSVCQDSVLVREVYLTVNKHILVEFKMHQGWSTERSEATGTSLSS